MKYLLVTYVPVFDSQSADTLRFTRRHWDDLSAQTAALAGEGFAVTLATPFFDSIDSRTLARETFIDVPKRDRAFDYLPLPAFRTMRKFLAVRGTLLDRVAKTPADVVQLGAGGHPIPLGQAAWEAASGRKRVFVFANDPFPAMQAAITSGHNPAKRIGKKMALQRFEEFCRSDLKSADLIIAHSPAVVERFKNDWNNRCYVFDPAPLRDAQLSTPERATSAGRPLRLIAVGDSLATAGLDHLIGAVAQARRLSANVELALLGNVSESEALTSLLRSESLEPVIRLLGNPTTPEATAKCFDEADILLAGGLIPRPFDTIFLAAARGLPMVGYAGQSPGDALSAAGGAVTVPRGEQRLLAAAVLDLSRDRDRIVKLSSAARAWASESTLDAVHRKRAALVKGLLSR